MNEITILLSPQPNAPKADFLCTVQPMTIPNLISTTGGNINYNSNHDDLPFEMTLDSYTREAWSVQLQKQNDKSCTMWCPLWLKSIDNKKRLPGFLQFLKQRSKAAFGKFESPYPDEKTGDMVHGILVVPFEQPSYPSEDVLKDLAVTDLGDLIYVQYCLDERKVFKKVPKVEIPKGASMPLTSSKQPILDKDSNPLSIKQRMNSSTSQSNSKMIATANKAATTSQNNQNNYNKNPSKKAKQGLLGNLLGAQQRTSHHLSMVPTIRNKKEDSLSLGGGGGSANQIIESFRSKIEQLLSKFASNPDEHVLKVPIILSQYTRLLVEDDEDGNNNDGEDEKSKINMDVLKYIVMEQSDEIGNDEWIAVKEPAEYMDEAVIAIYKPGHAPEEVLESINQGELPDEIKLQLRALMEARHRELKRKEKEVEDMNLKNAVNSDSFGGADGEVLNTKKRDRRTLEEIQRDMMNDNKKYKM